MSKNKFDELAQFGNSEVFSEFYKLMSEKGLVKKAKEGNAVSDYIAPESAESKKQIESKYDVYTETEKTGNEFVEKAHPEAPANTIDTYLNNGGLIENSVEAQKAVMKAVERKPNGSVSHRIAKIQSLCDALIVVADEMDLHGEAELSKYADSVLQNIVSEISKKKS